MKCQQIKPRDKVDGPESGGGEVKSRGNFSLVGWKTKRVYLHVFSKSPPRFRDRTLFFHGEFPFNTQSATDFPHNRVSTRSESLFILFKFPPKWIEMPNVRLQELDEHLVTNRIVYYKLQPSVSTNEVFLIS